MVLISALEYLASRICFILFVSALKGALCCDSAKTSFVVETKRMKRILDAKYSKANIKTIAESSTHAGFSTEAFKSRDLTPPRAFKLQDLKPPKAFRFQDLKPLRCNQMLLNFNIQNHINSDPTLSLSMLQGGRIMVSSSTPDLLVPASK